MVPALNNIPLLHASSDRGQARETTCDQRVVSREVTENRSEFRDEEGARAVSAERDRPSPL